MMAKTRTIIKEFVRNEHLAHSTYCNGSASRSKRQDSWGPFSFLFKERQARYSITSPVLCAIRMGNRVIIHEDYHEENLSQLHREVRRQTDSVSVVSYTTIHQMRRGIYDIRNILQRYMVGDYVSSNDHDKLFKTMISINNHMEAAGWRERFPIILYDLVNTYLLARQYSDMFRGLKQWSATMIDLGIPVENVLHIHGDLYVSNPADAALIKIGTEYKEHIVLKK